MLDSIIIDGFRKYSTLSLDGFSRVNFILGNNNVGKTSVLEGIYAWACGQNIIPFLNIPLARGRYSNIQQPYWMMEEVLSLVNNKHTIPLRLGFKGIVDGEVAEFKHTIYPSELLTDFDVSYKKNKESYTLPSSISTKDSGFVSIPALPGLGQMTSPIVVAKWDIEHNGNVFSTSITAPVTQVSNKKPYHLAKFIDLLAHTGVSETVQIYAALKREKLLDSITFEISKAFPEIAGFDMIPYPDGSQSPISVIKQDGTMLPLYSYGDGVQRWFYILGAIALYKNSIICIDELDTGFHAEAHYKFCKHLIAFAEANNVQLFLTTHNLEFVDHFLDAASENENKGLDAIRIITLRENNGSFSARVLNGLEASEARDSYKVDLR